MTTIRKESLLSVTDELAAALRSARKLAWPLIDRQTGKPRLTQGEWQRIDDNIINVLAKYDAQNVQRLRCDCGFVGLRHTERCQLFHLTAEGGFQGSYPAGGGGDDSDE